MSPPPTPSPERDRLATANSPNPRGWRETDPLCHPGWGTGGRDLQLPGAPQSPKAAAAPTAGARSPGRSGIPAQRGHLPLRPRRATGSGPRPPLAVLSEAGAENGHLPALSSLPNPGPRLARRSVGLKAAIAKVPHVTLGLISD